MRALLRLLQPFRNAALGAALLCLLSACATSPDGSIICTGAEEFQKQSFYSTLAVTRDGQPCRDAIDAEGCRGPIQYLMENLTIGLRETSRAMFESIVYGEGSGFRTMVGRLIILYITIYGLMLAIGMMQITAADAIIRGLKLGVIAMILSTNGANAFYGLAGRFFLDGSDWMLNQVNLQMASVNEHFFNASSPSSSTTAQGGAPSPAQREIPAWQAYEPDLNSFGNYGLDRNSGAFGNVDIVLAQLVSSPALRFYLACIYAFPYGWFFLFLLLSAFFFLIAAVGGAIWIYLISYIVRAVLLALGPVFLIMILFRQTFQYFDSWMKQLIMFSIQPIVLFIYLTMFMILLHVGLNDLFFGPQVPGGQNVNRMNVCLMEGPKLLIFQTWFWQFALPTHEPLASSWNLNGFTMKPYPFGEFPLRLEDMFIVFAICWIAKQFQDYIADMTMELATVYVGAHRFYGPRAAKYPFIAALKARQFAANHSLRARELKRQMNELEDRKAQIERFAAGTPERNMAVQAYAEQSQHVQELLAARQKAMEGIDKQKKWTENTLLSKGWSGSWNAFRQQHGLTIQGLGVKTLKGVFGGRKKDNT